MMTLDERLRIKMSAKRCRKMVFTLMRRHGYVVCCDFTGMLIAYLMEHNRALRGL